MTGIVCRASTIVPRNQRWKPQMATPLNKKPRHFGGVSKTLQNSPTRTRSWLRNAGLWPLFQAFRAMTSLWCPNGANLLS
jgi:hypothetical protein